MRATMPTKWFNPSGFYLSDLNRDPAFQSESNPDGKFKMVIVPIENEIRYMRDKTGNSRYIVSGEGYIVTGSDEKEIDEIARHHRKKWPGLRQIEVFDKADLF